MILQRRAGQTPGLPFFIEELLKALIVAGEIFYADGTWNRKPVNEVHIPRGVQGAVQRRVGQLTTAARQTITLAAVVGRRFDVELLGEVTDMDEHGLLQVIKELVAAQLVVEESADQFAFRHALTREAVYASMLRRERKRYHRSIAETIERLHAASLDAHLAELAYHTYEAEVWDKALTYSQSVGEQAQALYAPRAAVEHFTRALAAARQLSIPPSPNLYRARGSAHELLGDFEAARGDFTQALDTARAAHDGLAEWQCLIELGFLWAGRDYTLTGEYFRRALDLAATLADPKLRARSLNRLGNWLVNTGQAAEGLQTHREALEIFDGQQDKQGLAETYDLLGMGNAQYSDLVEGVKQSGRAIELFQELGNQHGLVTSLTTRGAATSLGYEAAFHTGRTLDASVNDLTEALRLSRQIGWQGGQAYAEFALGWAYATCGALGSALTHARQALRLATEIDHQQWITASYFTLGQIYVLALNPESAIESLEAALPLAHKVGSAWWIGNSTAYLALAYLQKKDLPRAEATLRAAMPPFDSTHDEGDQVPRNLAERRMLLAWGELALAQGQPGRALEISEHLIESAPGAPRPEPLPVVFNLKGNALIALERLDEAGRVLEDAKRTALEHQALPVAWKIHCALGQVHQLTQRAEQALDAFAAARTVIQTLAATLDDEGMRDRFLCVASESLPKAKSPSSRRAEAVKFGGLTTREREVARLIAQGKSNREIADALVVSERTIESHVGNILSKLGFGSRAQIAAWAVEKGLKPESSST